MRLPIRVRITAAFAAVMLILLAVIAALAYQRMGAALLDEIDSGLRFKAGAVADTTRAESIEVPDQRLQEPREAFEQFLSEDGQVLRATRGFTEPLLGPSALAGLTGPTFLDRNVPGVAARTRLLALPLASTGRAAFLVVGVSTSDRLDALNELAEVLLIGGIAAVTLACVSAWFVAGWALRPVDRMQRQAAAITASGLDNRMSVPRTRDELHRLARTLNDMLDRLDRSASAERRFLERASHELRTPLAALRAEIDLALRRRRSAAELAAALRNASEETDRLARLADDLLVLARAEDGRLPLHRETTQVSELLESSAALFAARATEVGVELTVCTSAATVEADPLRLRQLIVNLLDNALRHTPRGGTVRLTATADDHTVRIAVADSGPGLTSPLRLGDDAPGLGLRIVRAIATSHGGHIETSTAAEGGARVDVVLPATPHAAPAHPADEQNHIARESS
jgi:two-component system, OmpR family, sensor kinase